MNERRGDRTARHLPIDSFSSDLFSTHDLASYTQVRLHCRQGHQSSRRPSDEGVPGAVNSIE